MTKIGINGFGRIGRLVFRAIAEQGLLGKTVDVVAVNDLVPGRQSRLPRSSTIPPRASSTAPSRAKSRRPTWPRTMCSSSTATRSSASPSRKAPTALPWGKLGVDIVIESTGLFTEAEKAKGHIDRRREEGHHLRPGQGRGHHRRHGRQPREARRRQAQHHLQRELHHELPRPGRPRAAQGRLRHRGRPDDHDPQLHRHAEDGRRPLEEGLEGRPLRGDQHHPLHHRRRQGRRPRAARK